MLPSRKLMLEQRRQRIEQEEPDQLLSMKAVNGMLTTSTASISPSVKRTDNEGLTPSEIAAICAGIKDWLVGEIYRIVDHGDTRNERDVIAALLIRAADLKHAGGWKFPPDKTKGMLETMIRMALVEHQQKGLVFTHGERARALGYSRKQYYRVCRLPYHAILTLVGQLHRRAYKLINQAQRGETRWLNKAGQ